MLSEATLLSITFVYVAIAINSYNMHLCQTSCRGLLFAATSSFLFSICSLVAKCVGLNAAEISCISFLVVVTLSTPIVILRCERILPPRGYRFLFVARSVTGTVCLICSFRSVQFIPLGDASVIFATAPILTLVLAKVFLREPCTLYNVVMISVLMCGIILVTQPSILTSGVESSNNYSQGIIYAGLASLSEAAGNIILRKLKSFHFSIIMFNHGILSFFQTIFFLILTSAEKINFTVSVPLALLAFGTCCEQLLVTLALSVENAGPVALVQASDIIYGYLFQIFYFGEKIQFLPLLGALVITAVITHMAMHVRQEFQQRHTTII